MTSAGLWEHGDDRGILWVPSEDAVSAANSGFAYPIIRQKLDNEESKQR